MNRKTSILFRKNPIERSIFFFSKRLKQKLLVAKAVISEDEKEGQKTLVFFLSFPQAGKLLLIHSQCVP